MDVGTYVQLAGVTEVPQPTVEATVESDPTRQTVGVEIIEIDDFGDDARIAVPRPKEEGTTFATTITTPPQLTDQLLPEIG